GLPAALASGAVPQERVDDACRRILRTMLRFASVTTSPPDGMDAVASPAHRSLAREGATRAAVLLRNEPVDGAPLLPLADSGKTPAVIGPLADKVNTGDVMSSDVRPPEVITPLAGLQAGFSGTVVTDDGSDPARAAQVAAGADVAVVVVGYTCADE